VAVGTAAWGQALADYIDHHHPKLGSRLMQLRWGGLRTIEPQPLVVGPVLATGAGLGLGTPAGRSTQQRATLGAAGPCVAVGASLAWVGLWRWDTARWRRSHVMVVVGLPDDRLDELVAGLVDQGLDVQRWDRPRRADGPNHGVSCRLRDLRRVNAAIDVELTGGPG
jgi:hypothetical protein